MYTYKKKKFQSSILINFKHNLYFQLICKFFQMNHEWTILEYDRTRDRDKTDTENVVKVSK